MGMEMASEDTGSGAGSIETRPGFFVIGSPNVGKRTLLSRLLSIDFPDAFDLSSGILCQGWTIDTKYYSADVSIWIAHLEEGFSLQTLPVPKQLSALVMVFDMSEESSFLALQDWVASTEIKKFEILLCIGNKADLVPGHFAHAEYRRYLQKRGESNSDSHPEYLDYGIDETEVHSLLGEGEPSLEIRKSCLEWCSQNNIEYIEACASNADFDKCLSVDGDIQGVERLYGALSAHMWPGMVLKSGNRITIPSLLEKEEITDDESDYEIQYEVLSHGSDELWDKTGDSGMTSMEERSVDVTDPSQRYGIVDGGATAEASTSNVAAGESSTSETGTKENAGSGNATEDQVQKPEDDALVDTESSSIIEAGEELGVSATSTAESDEEAHFGLDDLERLMGEIANMRDSLRLMPDFQRREMAATLAMKMAVMFGESSDEDGL